MKHRCSRTINVADQSNIPRRKDVGFLAPCLQADQQATALAGKMEGVFQQTRQHFPPASNILEGELHATPHDES